MTPLEEKRGSVVKYELMGGGVIPRSPDIVLRHLSRRGARIHDCTVTIKHDNSHRTTQSTQARAGALMSPSSCLDGASHGWVWVSTHSTPVPTPVGRAVGSSPKAHQCHDKMSPNVGEERSLHPIWERSTSLRPTAQPQGYQGLPETSRQ